MTPFRRCRWFTWIHAIVVFGITARCSSEDPCQSEIITLRHTEYRDVEFTATDYDFEPICDRDTIVSGRWYRVSPRDDERMPETCPDLYTCGTVYPIWINGRHPTDDTIAGMKVFMHWRDNCRYWDGNNTIPVKRCPGMNGGHYYIYQLPNPPFCHSGYCVQKFNNTGYNGPTTAKTTTTPTPTTTNSECGRSIKDPSDSTHCLRNCKPSLQEPFVIYKMQADYHNVYIQATDLDDQTNLQFYLDPAPNINGIELTSQGRLSISNDVTHNVTLQVKVVDSCGASDVQIYRIYVLQCGCQPMQRCSEEVSSRKTHGYFCACPDGMCMAGHVQSCMSPVCSAGVSCNPDPYRDGLDCTCNSVDSEFRCPLDDSTGCAPWSQWSACSKSCDYGIRRRVTSCASHAMPVTETELCNKDNCPEVEDERDRGVIVEVLVNSDSTLEKVLLKQDEILNIIRLAINSICATDGAEDCCGRPVWFNPGSRYDFVLPNNIWSASGFPKVEWSSRVIRFKILAEIPASSHRAYCSRNSRHKRSMESARRDVPNHVIKQAVTDSVALLEQSFGITISDVREVNDVDIVRKKGIYLPAILGTVSVLMVIICIIIGVIMYRKNKQRSKIRQKKYLPDSRDHSLPDPRDHKSDQSHTQLDALKLNEASRNTMMSVDSFGTVWDDEPFGNGTYMMPVDVKSRVTASSLFDYDTISGDGTMRGIPHGSPPPPYEPFGDVIGGELEQTDGVPLDRGVSRQYEGLNVIEVQPQGADNNYDVLANAPRENSAHAQ